MRTASRILKSEAGVGLASAMLALSLLAVFALVAAGLAVNERRTSYNDAVHTRAFMAADSGAESAIGVLRQAERPPILDDVGISRVSQEVDQTLMDGVNAPVGSNHWEQEYDYDIRMPNDRPRMRARPGYSGGQFVDFFYDVNADGEAGTQGDSRVSLIVSKLYQMGYN